MLRSDYKRNAGHSYPNQKSGVGDRGNLHPVLRRKRFGRSPLLALQKPLQIDLSPGHKKHPLSSQLRICSRARPPMLRSDYKRNAGHSYPDQNSGVGDRGNLHLVLRRKRFGRSPLLALQKPLQIDRGPRHKKQPLSPQLRSRAQARCLRHLPNFPLLSSLRGGRTR
jgi:hypothetical protein